jgi:hypothetical protein
MDARNLNYCVAGQDFISILNCAFNGLQFLIAEKDILNNMEWNLIVPTTCTTSLQSTKAAGGGDNWHIAIFDRSVVASNAIISC